SGTARRAIDQTNNRMRILVADDEPPMRGLLGRTLKQLGHDVAGSVSDGDELLEEVARAKPQLVTLDLDMPGPDTYSIARELSEVHRVAVVVVSGRANIESATELA